MILDRTARIRSSLSLASAGDDLAVVALRVVEILEQGRLPVEAIITDLRDAVEDWQERRG